jgi:hypothetical protein
MMAAVRMGGGGASIRRRETTPGVGQAGPDGLMTRAIKEKFQEKNKMGRQGILGRIGNGPASLETKRKENGLLKECGSRSSSAEDFFLELFSRILSQNKEF